MDEDSLTTSTAKTVVPESDDNSEINAESSDSGDSADSKEYSHSAVEDQIDPSDKTPVADDEAPIDKLNPTDNTTHSSDETLQNRKESHGSSPEPPVEEQVDPSDNPANDPDQTPPKKRKRRRGHGWSRKRKKKGTGYQNGKYVQQQIKGQCVYL